MREHIHTIYDRLDANGVFATNPANPGSRDPITGVGLYKGPVPFPKMIYHPTGKTRVMNPGQVVNGPYGPEVHNRTYEIINKIVQNQAELDEWLKKGWHTHPSDAIAAGLTPEEIKRGVKAPAKSSVDRVASLEEEVKRLQAELAMAKTAPLQDDSPPEESEEEESEEVDG